MLKKLLLATTVCIALSACNDSSSSSNTEPSDPLETLSFENLSNVSSIARVETSSEDGSHLIGFDANDAPIGDISNMGVEDFTPTSDGGFVVEVTENHKASYLYQTVGDNGEEHAPIEHTYRHPAWYYVQPNGDYYLITAKQVKNDDGEKESPEFMGENSNGLLIFSNGESFDLQSRIPGQLHTPVNIAAASKIATLVSDIKEQINDPDNADSEQLKKDIKELLSDRLIEKITTVDQVSSDAILVTDKSNITSINLTTDNIVTPAMMLAINKALGTELSLFLAAKSEVSENPENILPIPNSDYTLLGQNIGIIDNPTITAVVNEPSINDGVENNGVWDGETAQDQESAYLLSSTQNNLACQDSNKQCLYSIKAVTGGTALKPTTTIESDLIINANTGFETESDSGQIEGGQQNYLWVNDSYIVIKEATQISIIDRADSNKLLDPVLAGTEIDTINLTDDNKLYITATDSSNTPAAYIYDIATDTMSNDISNGEKLHALKALIK